MKASLENRIRLYVVVKTTVEIESLKISFYFFSPIKSF
jgi:hypothetical protein